MATSTQRKTAASRKAARAGKDTNDDALLEKEALRMDTDDAVNEPKQAPAKSGGNGAAGKPEAIKHSGKDAENFKLKKAKKRSNRTEPADDLKGPLEKLDAADYLDLIMPLHVELSEDAELVKEKGCAAGDQRGP